MKPIRAFARSKHRGACRSHGSQGGGSPWEGTVLLEFAALVVFGIVAFGLLIAAVIVLPLMLVAGVLKFFLFAILLPFRLIGALLGMVTGVAGAVFGGIATLGSVLLAALFAVGALLFLPLLPIIALLGLIWLISRSARKART